MTDEDKDAVIAALRDQLAAVRAQRDARDARIDALLRTITTMIRAAPECPDLEDIAARTFHS